MSVQALSELIPDSWKPVLINKETKYLLDEIDQKLGNNNSVIYPARGNIFRALELTNWNNVKVVILGQDPYHGPDQAHGLSFSVNHGVTIPSSLCNIFRELQMDIEGFKRPCDGNLESWANQGVLLLNTILTVEAGQPNSHKMIGWEAFTNHIIETISSKKQQVVFILWGKQAQAKLRLIDTRKHVVFMSAHPSGYSAHKGFFGCRHFSKTNEYLRKCGKTPINW